MWNGADDTLFDPAQPLIKEKTASTSALWDSSGCPPTMPVAIRKRSWEEHVTHPSGLKYSFDDLDLVCCHGVDGTGPWTGAEASQQGRRTRCASMPEGCHQLSSDDLVVTCEATATFVEDNTENKQLNEMRNQENVSLDLQDLDIVDTACVFENADTENKDNPGEYHCNSNSLTSCANLSGAAISQRLKTETVSNEGEVGVESCYNVCTDADAFKRPHVLLVGQQCISISSNNGLPLSGSAGVQTGKHSNHQETKERHTEGYSRPAENPDATLNWSLITAEGKPPTDMPDVEKEEISTSEHADAHRNFIIGLLPSPVHVMEEADIMCPADKSAAGEPVVKAEASHLESCSQRSFERPRIKNDLETLNENTEVKPQSRDNGGGNRGHPDCTGVLDQTGYNEITHQNSVELTNITVTQMSTPGAVESPQAGSSEKSNQVRYGAAASPDIFPKGQLCSTLVSSCVSFENVDAASTEKEECVAPPAEDMNTGSGSGDESTFCVNQAAAYDLENSCKLDTIPEVSCVETDDLTGSHPHDIYSEFIHCQTDSDLTDTQQQDHHRTSCRVEINAELSSEGIHGNRASGCDSTKSPGSEVTDGQRDDHRPGATVSNVEETDEAVHVTAHLTCRINEAEEPEVMREDAVRMRTRKPEHARLDSMVLLLMKLDQLDQEIENALSATSSIDSTPTLNRRPLLNPLSIPEQEKAEIEAKEACTWLRAAGFPQYAQLYEDALFPIDISSVTRDHDFLDRDAIEALCRRLNTLNKCALMRLEISPQRKRSEDSDEDELCAISGRWTFQRDSKRWSRMEELDVFSTLSMDDKEASSFPKDHVPQKGKHVLHEGNSSESVLTDLSEQPEVVSIHSSGSGGRGEEKGHGATLVNESAPAGATRASSVTSMCSSSGTGGSGCANEDSLSDGLPPSPLESLGQFTFDMKTGIVGLGGNMERGSESSKSTRSRAKSFLKRMESLRLRSSSTSKRKKKGSITGGKIEISGPVIKEGLDDDKLRRLNCVDIPSISFHQNLNHHRNPTQTMTLNRNRSVSYSTQTSNGSTGSTGSSQSEASSGSAVSTPSPVTRARSHSTAAGSSKRGGMYLEGFDPLSILQQTSDRQPKPPPNSSNAFNCPATNGMTVHEQNHKNNYSYQSNGGELGEEEEEEDEGMLYFYLPEGHKPGTFPKALEDGSSRNNNGIDNGNLVVLRGRQSRRQRRGSSGSVDSRLSFYDNVPYTEREEEVEEEGDEGKLEEVLKHVSGLKRFNAWSEAVVGEEEEEEEEDEEEEGDSDSALDSASPCPSSPLQNRLEETENGSDQDSTGNPLGEGEEGMRERRDSGVGASLTRTSRPQKLRWPSFQNSHRPSLASAQLQISCQSVLQMNLLQKLSLLQLTALLEKHTPANKHGFSWAVPKFMKRIKVRDYKDRNVFGVPLQVIVQRTGQPLPQGIQQAMRFLRNQCLDQVGLFRKSGVKSRIQALRQMNEASGADGGGVSYEGQSAYDVADMLKQYFRDLPEPLLTSKLSETFLQIYQYMPKELRLQAARAAVLLLPDENREALRTLLCFLSDVTASVAENQMTPTNLAVCLAPSLFHLNTLRRKESSSPRVMNRKQILGKPDQKDLNENLAATHGVAHMIQECRKLFRIPEEMNRCRNSYMEQALLPRCIKDLCDEQAGNGGYRTYLRNHLDALLKEAKDKFRGYDSCSTPEQAELACRKVHDGFPLRQWKVTIEVPASPEEVLTRVLREQGHWDEDLLESRVVESLDDKMEVYQYVRNTMAPHPTRDHVVLRSWVTDLPKGACALVCTSVDHEGAPVVGVRANVLTSRYFIEPCGSNKSRLTHISRIDCRGRFPEWYNKLYGHLCAAEVVRIRESFSAPLDK